ncbi:MAG: hypothetical protein RIQ47_637 [Bacteroidota bacterium]|jgi:hypothetical protein
MKRRLKSRHSITRTILMLLGVGVWFLGNSCKVSKPAAATPPPAVTAKGTVVNEVFDSVLSRQFDFEWLSAKAQVDYTDKSGETNSFDINLRMRKDSAIWISITPLLGIEAARVLINRDSLVLMDRVHKEWKVRSYDYLGEMLRTPIDFEMIQSVVLGNYFSYQRNERIRSYYEEQPYAILSTLNKRQARRAMEEKDPSRTVIQDFWIDGNYRIVKSRITDEKLDRWVEASYSEFMAINDFLFPRNIVVTFFSGTPVIMKVSYSKVTNEESLTMPFTIPDKYDRK